MPLILLSLLILFAPSGAEAHQPEAAIVTTQARADAHRDTAVSDDDIVPVEFSTLSGFDWQEGQEMPAAVKALNGKKIGISGFIRSFDGSDEEITGFWLVDQNCDCEGIPKMNEVIVCWMPEGKSISNDGSPIRIVGSFEVGEQKDGDYVTSIFRLNVEVVD